jgi:hypothetical protein
VGISIRLVAKYDISSNEMMAMQGSLGEGNDAYTIPPPLQRKDGSRAVMGLNCDPTPKLPRRARHEV